MSTDALALARPCLQSKILLQAPSLSKCVGAILLQSLPCVGKRPLRDSLLWGFQTLFGVSLLPRPLPQPTSICGRRRGTHPPQLGLKSDPLQILHWPKKGFFVFPVSKISCFAYILHLSFPLLVGSCPQFYVVKGKFCKCIKIFFPLSTQFLQLNHMAFKILSHCGY